MFRKLDGYRIVLILLMILFVLVFAGMAFDQHTGMRTHKSDLGQMDQALWNTSRGRFVESIRGEALSTRMTDHVEPIFVLISPVLWLWDDVRALLLVQVLMAALGAWPLFELARRQTSPLIALALAAAYLLDPHLQSAVLTEFHAIPLVVPLILWAFWAIEMERWRQFVVAAVLVACVKEEAALLAAGLGVWAVIRGRRAEIRGRRAEGGGRRAEARGRRAEIRGRRAEGGDQRAEVGGRRSEARGRRAEIRGRRAEGGGRRSEARGRKSEARGRRAEIRGRRAEGGDQRAEVGGRRSEGENGDTQHAVRTGLLVTLLALTWFYLSTFVIIPAFAVQAHGSAESAYFARYGALGDSPLGIFTSFFTQPGLVWEIFTEPARLQYLFGLLAAFGFLGIFAPEIILLALPVLLANQLSAYPAQYYGEFHYSAPLVPYFAVAAVYGAGRLTKLAASKWLQALLIAWVLIWAGISYLQVGRGPLGGHYDPTPISDHQRLLPGFVQQIPADAAVTATSAVHPHVSHRRYVYQFPLGLDAAVPAAWALIDVTTNTDMAPGDVKTTVDAMLAADWGVVDAADGLLLLQRGAAAKAIPPAFYDFTRAQGNPAPAPGPLAFSGIGVDDWQRWRQTKIVTHWQIGADFAPGSVRPWLEVRAPDGRLLYTFDQLTPPALIWLPPDRWQPGDLIRIETLALNLPRSWGAVVGAVHGPNPTAPADRLPISAVIADPGLPTDPTHTLALAAAFRRHADARLQQLDAFIFPAPRRQTNGIILNPNGQSIPFQTWLAPGPAWPGAQIDLAIDWGSPFPDGFIAFAHLRHAGENVAQSDAPPTLFIPTASRRGLDWRALDIPADLAPGDQLDIVIGVYNPASGERLNIVDAGLNPLGNELTRHTITLGQPPVPDQPCALIPATCTSQP